MTHSEFLEYREAFLKMLSKKTRAEVRALRHFLAAVIHMEVEQVIILIQELAMMESAKNVSCQEEFNRLMQKEFPGR